MSAVKQEQSYAESLAVRLIGISCPIAGIDWNPPHEERSRVIELLQYFASRRGLYRPYSNEIGHFILPMVTEMRDNLAREFEAQRRETPYKESLAAMHAACRKFLDRTSYTAGIEYRLEILYAGALGELRAMVGLHIARLACAYDIEIPSELVVIIPAYSELRTPAAMSAGFEEAVRPARKVTRKRPIRRRAAKR